MCDEQNNGSQKVSFLREKIKSYPGLFYCLILIYFLFI